MAERLDFEVLWPFKLHRFGTYRGDGPCVLEVVSFLDGGPVDDDNPRCVCLGASSMPIWARRLRRRK
jgi:hypothetical protein